jgi:hypothetical protein
MANWDWALNTIFPDRGGERARITSTFAQHLARNPPSKGGVDVSYPSAVAPPVFTPIAGKVISAGSDSWNTVNIVDKDGNKHGFLHMSRVTVSVGMEIKAGTQIGNEGGMGPVEKGRRKSNTAYTAHLHYQITDNATGKRVDPVAWWNGNRDPGEIDPNADSSEVALDENGQPTDPSTLPDTSSPPPPPVGSVEEYKPKQAAPSQVSQTSLAVWTNRMPMHEPWPRVLLVDSTTNKPTDSYHFNVNHLPQIADLGTEKTSGQIGRLEGDEITERNPFWRR